MENNEHIQNQFKQSTKDNPALKKSQRDGHEYDDGHIDENISKEKAGWKTHMDLLLALLILSRDLFVLIS